MKVNVYTRDDKVQSVEFTDMEVGEYFLIQKALLNMTSNMEVNVEERLLAVMLTENMNNKEQIELNDMN